ncbi:tRNA (adenosine(37)-N6)-threonylcarbamoyltransferase complex dimerization subunit type 1 TsaB [Cumulibacter manganitolerans]|uniref:tRNA (adenosine(37)-N6)-threonylcarbamoyltransferase complex dimerization subunit type 1 TsaB n=1 Tax=Cumulibacter manganitolerans TaxID=1884992 RepID=UPI001296688A|nr:tRNA (adenosine(37)-N6)-threonylcarbamoyltransferase complex dimerization subunit type 1 TsaB [Cumulibacter manganitolerans]
MRLLAIDTATPRIVTGVVETSAGPARTLAAVSHEAATSHAEVLTPAVRQVAERAGIALGDLDGVVVGLGPGPFTGLRVGIVTAAALGDALGVPVWGVCTLDAMAPPSGRVLVVTDARRKELYFATYHDGVRAGEPSVAVPEDVVSAAAGVERVVHAGAERYLDRLGSLGAAEEGFPTPESLVAVAAREGLLGGASSVLQPIYIRRPDAAEPRERPPLDVVGPTGR